jgi:hypothetical protein
VETALLIIQKAYQLLATILWARRSSLNKALTLKA